MNIKEIAEVNTTCVSVELYVEGVKAREWLGCGEWNVEAAQKIADEINGKAVIRDEASISSYKAELLKEVGEPVAHIHRTQTIGEQLSWYGESSNYGDPDPVKLYTSDQVAAAILKATKPLEEEVAMLKDGKRSNIRLHQQLAAAQEEISRLKEIEQTNDTLLDQLGDKNAALLDQLATAEQRVAEACADVVGKYSKIYAHGVIGLHSKTVENEIRSGEYRKFMKEV